MILDRVRQYVRSSPGLYRFARPVRTVTLVGPLRSILIAAEKRLSRTSVPPDLGPTLLPGVDPTQTDAILERDGIAVLGQLPSEAVDAIIDFLDALDRDSIDNAHLESEAVRRVALDSTLVETARKYLGAEPILQLTRMWISRPGVEFTHANRFHFDVAEPKSLTAFVYLTDVEDAEHGAHVVVEGTHNHKTFTDHGVGYLREEDVPGRYGDRTRTILGPRGTVFMEELTIFHRGTRTQYPRIVLSITYTLRKKPDVEIRLGTRRPSPETNPAAVPHEPMN